MKCHPHQLLVPSFLAAILVFAASATAQTIYLTGGNGTKDWDSNTWTGTANSVTPMPDVRPIAGNNVQLGYTNNAAQATLRTVQLGTTITPVVNNVQWNISNSAVPTYGFNVNSTGVLTASGTFFGAVNAGITLNIGITGSGGINLTGAGVTHNLARGATTTTTVTQSNGSFSIAANMIMANAATAVATYNLSGGSFQVQGNLTRGTGTSTLNWTGGSFVSGANSSSDVVFTNNGTGTFNVGGTDTVGTFTQTAANAYTQGENATMRLDIASAGSFDKFQATAVGSSILLDGNIELHLLGGYTPTFGTTFDVMSADTLTDNGFVLTGAAASFFTYSIVDVGGFDTLRLSAVPEPGTVGLIALGLGSVLFWARRRTTR